MAVRSWVNQTWHISVHMTPQEGLKFNVGTEVPAPGEWAPSYGRGVDAEEVGLPDWLFACHTRLLGWLGRFPLTFSIADACRPGEAGVGAGVAQEISFQQLP